MKEIGNEDDDEDDDVDEELLRYLKGKASTIYHDIKKFLLLRTQKYDKGIFHHYEHVDYTKKISVTSLVDLKVCDLDPSTCVEN